MTRPTVSRSATSRQRAAWALVALLVAVWTAALVRLPGPAVTDPDGHASALYFERLTTGTRLEEPLLSTPKPLLTLTHGLAWTLTHDWRTVTLLTIAAFALAVVALARTAYRLAGAPASAPAAAAAPAIAPAAAAVPASVSARAPAPAVAGSAGRHAGNRGPAALRGQQGEPEGQEPPLSAGGQGARAAGLAAAAATVVVVAGSGPLILQVARGNSLIWALAGWAVAAGALAGRSDPRWRRAGLALFLAALSRSESWLLLPLLLLAVLVAWRRRDRAAAWLLLPLLAPVIWAAHDLLLTGDPLWSSKIPVRYTDIVSGRNVILPLAWVAEVARRYAAEPALLALAAAGAFALARMRAWGLLAGAAVLSAGVLTLLGWYAYQGVYVSFRYFDPPDLTLRALAALGAAWLATAIVGAAVSRTRARRLRPVRPPASPGPTDRDRDPDPDPDPPEGTDSQEGGHSGKPSPSPLLRRLAIDGRWSGAAAVALAATAAVAITWPVAPTDPIVDSTLDRDTRLAANASRAAEALRPLTDAGQHVTVSGPQRVRLALALDRPLTQVEDLFLATLTTPLAEALTGTTAVFHDADGDRPPDRFTPLTRASPGQLGPLRLDPTLTDPSTGLYVHRVAPAG